MRKQRISKGVHHLMSIRLSLCVLTATAIAVLCLAVDVTVLCVLAAQVANGWRGPLPLIAVAATASTVRIAAAITAVRSIRRTRDMVRKP